MFLFSLIATFHLHDVVLSVALFTTTNTTTVPAVPVTLTTTENVKFVQKLKEHLRRNNDDYILGRNLTQQQEEQQEDTAEQSSAYIDDIEEVYRRALVDRGTQHLTIRNKHNIGQARRPVLPAPASAPAPLYYDKNMIQETNNKMAGVVNGAKGDNFQFRAAAEQSSEKAFSPSVDQLDMAPAKGGRVSILRKKGRLCQRHVLIPEGPKYDSHGRVYLRAHPAHAVRPYARTRSPRLLLPRCCNCCKKSVLGCE